MNAAAERGTQVTATAEQALAAMDDGAGPVGDPDRADLARLLSAVGAAQTAGASLASQHERERWSEVCEMAMRIAGRLDRELKIADSGFSIVIPLYPAT